MPVTARLSKRFYDVFGEEIANELVDWFNQVDDTYRTDLREANELNFSRFDAKLEQRLAESDAKWERRFAESDTKWERRFAEFDAKLEQRLAELRTELVKELADVKSGLTAILLPAPSSLLRGGGQWGVRGERLTRPPRRAYARR